MIHGYYKDVLTSSVHLEK